jgi:protein-S-isoprenylcysteine O-methyltransferase Ste14
MAISIGGNVSRVDIVREVEATGTDRPTAGIPFPPPTVYVLGLLIAIPLELLFPTGSLPVLVTVIGTLIGVAVSLYMDGAAMSNFSKADTPAIPFKPTEALVTTGPYRFTRNPMYVGMAALYIALALVFGLLWAFAFLPFVILVIDRQVIAREEPYLERLFGQEYLDYKKRVRRWL